MTPSRHDDVAGLSKFISAAAAASPYAASLRGMLPYRVKARRGSPPSCTTGSTSQNPGRASYHSSKEAGGDGSSPRRCYRWHRRGRSPWGGLAIAGFLVAAVFRRQFDKALDEQLRSDLAEPELAPVMTPHQFGIPDHMDGCKREVTACAF